MKRATCVAFLAVMLASCGGVAESVTLRAEQRWQPEPGLSWQ